MTDSIDFPSPAETIIIAAGWSTDLEPQSQPSWVYWLLVRQDGGEICDHVATYDTYEECRAEALEWARERGCRIEKRLQSGGGA